MRTIVLREPGRFELAETPAPGEPGPGEALVRVRRVGLCGTDIHAYRGRQPFFTYPRILGHELGVEVLRVGDGVASVNPGDRCAVEPYVNQCGTCPTCRLGKTNCCPAMGCLGVHLDGGMRDEIVLPADHLHRSEALPFEALALVETLGIGKHAVNRADVTAGETVAVLGLGPIGLTVAQFAMLAGADVVGVDLSPVRAEASHERLGLTTLVSQGDAPLPEQWAATFGELPLKVFDATGHAGSMHAAFDLPVPGGTLTLVGLVLGELSFDDPSFHRRELTLLASRNAVADDLREIIGHLEAGRIDVQRWITHHTPADAFPGVIDDWLAPDAGLLKGVLDFGG